MREYLNYTFTLDAIKKMDPKFKNELKYDFISPFYLANFKDMTYYYNLFRNKKKPEYNLLYRLNNEKQIEAVRFIIKYIQENDYDKELVMFFDAYVATIVLNKFMREYIYKLFPNIKKRGFYRMCNALNALYYEKRNGKKITKFEVPEYTEYGPKTLDLFKKIYSDVYYFSYGINVFEKAVHKYQKYRKLFFKDFFGIKKFILKVWSVVTFLNKHPKKILSGFHPYNSITKLLYHHSYNITYKNEEYSFTFDELYEFALKEAIPVLDMANNVLYYNKDDKKFYQALDEVIML